MRVAVIGLGVIATKYIDAMKRSDQIDLVFACDLIETQLWHRICHETACIKDYKQIPLNQVDLVFITTPPETHEVIANYFIEHGTKVFLEKPATKDYTSTKRLINYAKEHHTYFDLIFHWLYGNEVIYLKNHLDLIKDFDECHIQVFDPYYNTKIDPTRLHLGGAWLDSGVNALSFLSLFISLNDLKLIDKYQTIDESSGLDYEQHREYKLNNQNIKIDIKWDEKTNLKITAFKKGEHTIIIHHSNQQVILDGKVIYDGNHFDRLSTHYYNFFNQIQTHTYDLNRVDHIHQKLFE